ncbi:hypothetical protein [Conexibacter sp. SYSU D00693]|uniref:hypothetical protein n=1 Tax=Conexibacter sp. SYSU D00693 TaxID=2812560 RepID=UPI00196A83B2|nr:hypothetical protein [Conexibacter sp. SYSU D00693]
MPSAGTVATAAAALAALLAAGTVAPAQTPPKMPPSTKGTTSCGTATGPSPGVRYKTYRVRGSISCKAAKRLAARIPEPRGWRYFDWTKGGRGPWTDVLVKEGGKTTIGFVLICTPALCGDDG